MQATGPSLYADGPAASHLIPHDPLHHTTSSIPPTFLLALLCIVLGIPAYLVCQGAFKTTEDSLENKIKKADDSFSAAAGEKKEKKRDVDDPAPPLDLQDLQGLGGLVGLAAIFVMAFALFPEEINTMMGGLAERTTSVGMGLLSSSAPSPAPPGPPPVYQAPEDYVDTTSDREYLAEQGILPSWAEEMPEEQWWDSKSAKEIMLTCRIKPWLCDEDSLPIVKPAKRSRPRAIPRQTQVIRETVHTEAVVDSTAVSTATAPAQVSFLEQHMAVLRSQPILMLPYDEDSVIDLSCLVLFILFLLPLPFLYGYREVLINAGKVEDTARKEDKKLSLERKAEEDVAKNQAKAEVARAKAQKYKAEMKELEAADDLQHGWRDEFMKRPWWAPADWKPDEETDAKSKRPWRKPRNLAGKFDTGEDGKPKTMINSRHYKLDFDAEWEEAAAKRHEADNARILAKYPTATEDKESQPFRGVPNPFAKTKSGRESVKKVEESIKERSDLEINYAEAYDKYYNMRRQRKGSSDKKKVQPLTDKWDALAKQEQKERDESRWTINRYRDPKDPKPAGPEQQQQEALAKRQAEAAKGQAGAKPTGFLQKANGLLNKVGKA